MKLLHIILALLCLSPVFALTASPATLTTQYHQGTEEYSLLLTNDEVRSLTLTLQPTGPLSQLMSVQSPITLAPGESKTVLVRFTLPDTTQPGVLESGILIEARPVAAGTVSATSAVLHIIRVETPREGTYLAAELLSSSGIADEPVTLTLVLTNTGTRRIERSFGVITVLNDTLTTAAVTLQPGETKNLVVVWPAHAAGVYRAAAHVVYDGESLDVASDLIIGTLAVKILDVSTSTFLLGEPLVVRTEVHNDWGAQLPVRARTHIEQQGRTVATGQSTALLVSAQSDKTISTYMETTDVLVGEATLFVDVYYADKVVQTSVPLVVGIDSLEPTRSETPKATYAVLVVLALIFFFVVSIIFIKRRRSLP